MFMPCKMPAMNFNKAFCNLIVAGSQNNLYTRRKFHALTMKTAKDWFSQFRLSVNPSRNAETWDARRIVQGVPLVALLVLSVVTAVQAQSTWVAGATTNNVWNKNLNWSPNTVPNSFTVITIFGPAKVTNLFVDLKVDVGEIQLPANAPAYTITVNAGQSLSLHGFGVNNSSGITQAFVNNGTLQFNAQTTAGNQVSIANNSILEFTDRSGAGSATITTNSGGSTLFVGFSNGDTAQFITNGGGHFDISALLSSGTTAGSISGAGTYNLGSKELTVGSDGLSTEVNGLIEGAGGSLVKVGTGTLTLTGNNTYSGGTTIQAGALVAGTPTRRRKRIFERGNLTHYKLPDWPAPDN